MSGSEVSAGLQWEDSPVPILEGLTAQPVTRGPEDRIAQGHTRSDSKARPNSQVPLHPGQAFLWGDSTCPPGERRRVPFLRNPGSPGCTHCRDEEGTGGPAGEGSGSRS